MKKFALSFALATILSITHAQPLGFNYQTVVRDAGGQILANQTILFEISILQGSASGAIVYTETHDALTNQFGLASLEIGSGDIINGDFESIDWGSDSFYLKVSADLEGGSNYLELGVSQILSVPYSLYSRKSEGDYWSRNQNSIYYDEGHVAIGTNNPDPSAALQVESSAGGFLLPRMDQQHLEDLIDPANGLMVFNTTNNSVYVYVKDSSAWMQMGYGVDRIQKFASYLIGNGDYCSNSSINGDFFAGDALTGANFATLQIEVLQKGTYVISTDTLNGYFFRSEGIFNSTGIQLIDLQGFGTPGTRKVDTFYVSGFDPGESCHFYVSVKVHPFYPPGAVHCSPDSTIIQDVVNMGTNKIWMDRNLGAAQVATSSTDQDSYGDLYQWGRFSDGHQCRTSNTNSTLSDINNPPHGDFIVTTAYPYDWRDPQNDSLWQNGINGINNPCPEGYRIPTIEEWEDEWMSWGQGNQNAQGAFDSPLHLPAAGYRHFGNGLVLNEGISGNYWSSSSSGVNAQLLSFGNLGTNGRAFGHSVRCIKDSSLFLLTAINLTVHGSYFMNHSLNETNHVTLKVYVGTTGDWYIETDFINGYGFKGSGVFTANGSQYVTIYGYGNPENAQTDIFTATNIKGKETVMFTVEVNTF